MEGRTNFAPCGEPENLVGDECFQDPQRQIRLESLGRVFFSALHRQKTRLEKKMERERIIADMPELTGTLLQLARKHGRITVAEAARITDASRHTNQDHLKALVKQGRLVLHGAGRGAWYGLS